MAIRITIRFTEEETMLHDAITKSAQNNRRSLNGELLHALDFYLKNAPEAQYIVNPIAKAKEVASKKSPTK